MKRASEEKIMERLRQQQKRLAERLAKLQARKRAADRKTETRQKVLLGAYLRAWMDKDPEIEKRVMKGLEHYLKRDIDRAVFDLELHGDGTLKSAKEDAPEAACNGDNQVAAAG